MAQYYQRVIMNRTYLHLSLYSLLSGLGGGVFKG